MAWAPTTPSRSKWPAAYTVFANGGVRLSPLMVNSVRSAHGDVLDEIPDGAEAGLDPRVAYVMTT